MLWTRVTWQCSKCEARFTDYNAADREHIGQAATQLAVALENKAHDCPAEGQRQRELRKEI